MKREITVKLKKAFLEAVHYSALEKARGTKDRCQRTLFCCQAFVRRLWRSGLPLLILTESLLVHDEGEVLLVEDAFQLDEGRVEGHLLVRRVDRLGHRVRPEHLALQDLRLEVAHGNDAADGSTMYI